MNNLSNNGIRGCVYAVVRYLPNPTIGEFINIGIILLDPKSGEWGYRQVRKYKHLFRLTDGKGEDVVKNFFDSLPNNTINYAPRAGTDTEKEPNWLNALYSNMRGVIQFSTPLPTLSSVLEDTIDELYDLFIVEE